GGGIGSGLRRRGLGAPPVELLGRGLPGPPGVLGVPRPGIGVTELLLRLDQQLALSRLVPELADELLERLHLVLGVSVLLVDQGGPILVLRRILGLGEEGGVAGVGGGGGLVLLLAFLQPGGVVQRRLPVLARRVVVDQRLVAGHCALEVVGVLLVHRHPEQRRVAQLAAGVFAEDALVE